MTIHLSDTKIPQHSKVELLVENTREEIQRGTERVALSCCVVVKKAYLVLEKTKATPPLISSISHTRLLLVLARLLLLLLGIRLLRYHTITDHSYYSSFTYTSQNTTGKGQQHQPSTKHSNLTPIVLLQLLQQLATTLAIKDEA